MNRKRARGGRNKSGVGFRTTPARGYRMTSFTSTILLTVTVLVLLASFRFMNLHIEERTHSLPFISDYGIRLNGFVLLPDQKSEVSYLGRKGIQFRFNGGSTGSRARKYTLGSICFRRRRKGRGGRNLFLNKGLMLSN